jgi:hypothetical protein
VNTLVGTVWGKVNTLVGTVWGKVNTLVGTVWGKVNTLVGTVWGKSEYRYLGGDGVGFADLVAPEAAPDRNDGELGKDDGAPDGGGHLLAALHAQAHVTVVVSNG